MARGEIWCRLDVPLVVEIMIGPRLMAIGRSFCRSISANPGGGDIRNGYLRSLYLVRRGATESFDKAGEVDWLIEEG